MSDTSNFYDQSYPADHVIWSQLMTSTDGLRKRVALALSEICVVSLNGLDLNWRSHAMHPLLGPARWPMRLATTGRCCRT